MSIKEWTSTVAPTQSEDVILASYSLENGFELEVEESRSL
jgi:hypothetical protein